MMADCTYAYLGQFDCCKCQGCGIANAKRGKVCPCVYRCVFRLVVNHCRSAMAAPPLCVRERLSWAFQDREFITDAYLVARRNLSATALTIYQRFCVGRDDWNTVARLVHMDRGRFFRAVYRIQECLGRLFCEVSPFPIYPIEEYFRMVPC